MKIKQALQNPFVLAAQGFVVGAAIFLSAMPRDTVPAEGAGKVEAAALTEKLDA